MSKAQRKPTVTSLAEELGVSTCTVSKILNRAFENATYAKETIRRVEALARKRKYRPNMHARSLRTRRSMSIGLVMPGGQPYFCGPLSERIEAELRRHGYQTFVGHTTEDSKAERQLLNTILLRGVDGLLWIPYGKKLRPRHLEIPSRFPLVLLDRPGCSARFPTVMTDNVAASRKLAERIRAIGHRGLVMLTTSEEDDSIVEREEGIRQVYDGRIRRLESPNAVSPAQEVVEMHRGSLRGKALVCLSQNLALGALAGLLDGALQPGKDLGFACFDDLPACEIWRPGLTRISQNLDLLAAEAVRLVLETIRDSFAPHPHEIRVPARLLWGDTMPAPAELPQS